MTTNNDFCDENEKKTNDYVKKSHNEQDLTELWKKGELKLGEHYYYTTIFSPTVYIQNFTRDVISFQDFKETVAEVLAPVPSFDELQSLNELLDSMQDTNKALAHRLNICKKLLKECRDEINECISGDYVKELCERIEEVLK